MRKLAVRDGINKEWQNAQIKEVCVDNAKKREQDNKSITDLNCMVRDG